MFVTLWEFEVKPGSEELFEQAYGPEGEWVRLFRRAEPYRGTRLLREVGDEEFEGLTVSERHLYEFES
jgi:heme-degrading monooxygenase HmoA